MGHRPCGRCPTRSLRFFGFDIAFRAKIFRRFNPAAGRAAQRVVGKADEFPVVNAVFPQLKGLGRSSTSEYYGIDGLGEATAFLKDAYLGHNLREISSELLRISDKDAHQVFGSPDDLKLRSSMTLFAHASPEDTVFRDVIEAYFDGREDQRTLRLLDL